MSEAPETAAPAAEPAPETAPIPSADAPAPAAPAPAEQSEGTVAVGTPPSDTKGEPAPTSETAAGDSEPEAEAEAALTPESYEFTLPEAFTANEALEKAAREAFASHGVPKDAAQPLVDLFTSTLEANAQAAQEAFNTQQASWKAEIDTMPEFKDGPTKEKALASIGRVIDSYGSPELREALNMYGIGNNPHLAKFMAKVAAELDEGAPAPAARPAPNGKDGRPSQPGRLAYPNTPEITGN